jgi:hypothetical protein
MNTRRLYSVCPTVELPVTAIERPNIVMLQLDNLGWTRRGAL